MLHGQVGYWGTCGGLVIGFSPGMLEMLDCCVDNRSVRVSVTADRMLTCYPDAEGLRVYSGSLHNALHDHLRTAMRPSVLKLETQLPRFEMAFVDFQVSDDGRLSATLPEDHLLPWPRLRECEDYDLATELRKALVTRMASALRAGLRSLPTNTSPPPRHVKAMAADWRACMDEARALVGTP